MKGSSVPVVLGLMPLFLASCGQEAPPPPDAEPQPVSGLVRVDGKPAAGVEVRLHPLNHATNADAPQPRGMTDAEGKFRLGLADGREGAPAGQYYVSLVWPSGAGGADRFGGTYEEPEGSGLVAIIEPGTAELPPFEVGSTGRGGGD